MKVNLIVCMSENSVIGANGGMPWRQKADLKRFRELTMGHTVIMGRKTFDALDKTPLEGRHNAVVTRDLTKFVWKHGNGSGIGFYGSLLEALAQAESRGETEVFVIGGGEMFKEAMQFADRIYLTQLACRIHGDTHFPDPWASRRYWKTTDVKRYRADADNQFDYLFALMEKVPVWGQGLTNPDSKDAA